MPKFVRPVFASSISLEDSRAKRSIVVKVIKLTAMKGEDIRFQFTREVEIHALVEHPTLLALRGFIPLVNGTNDPPAIVTRFMLHGSYDTLIAAERSGHSPPG
jgi:hypothetical protein